jgi:D-arabinitol 4-dehydrogenase
VTGLTLLHIGLGSFHRAHQAVYLHRLRESGDQSWSIVAGNIRDDPGDTVAALIRQNGAYILETVSPAGARRYERITSIREVVPYDPRLERLVGCGAEASTRIVSFTVTEAGYYLAPDNRLNLAHPDIRRDLAGGTVTIYGAVAAILRERSRRNAGPLTLLSCDNLRSNGSVFRRNLLEFLENCGEAGLRNWTLDNTTCPCSMVDRITPRPSADLLYRVKDALGIDDLASVMSESYTQWVIEDRFLAGRPALEGVGVEMVESVHAHEEAKIRILNASHSCIAWAGALLGLRFIHEAVAVPEVRQMAYRYVTDDVIPCLDSAEHPSPIDLAKYRDVVLERFGNPHVGDTNQRVVADSFSKVAFFVVPTLRERIAQGMPVAGTAVLLALFFAFLTRWHRGELDFDHQDRLLESATVDTYFSAADPLAAFCRDAALWGDLAGSAVMTQAVRSAHEQVLAFLETSRSAGTAGADGRVLRV